MCDFSCCHLCVPAPPPCSAVEGGGAESSGAASTFTKHTSHLTPSHLHFFTEWAGLAQEEIGYSRSREKGVWLTNAHTR